MLDTSSLTQGAENISAQGPTGFVFGSKAASLKEEKECNPKSETPAVFVGLDSAGSSGPGSRYSSLDSA